MSAPDPRQLVAVLADTAKLRVFSALVLAPADPPRTLSAIAAAAGVSAQDAARALGNLTAIGLAERTGGAGSDGGGSDGGGVEEGGGAVTWTATAGVFRESLSEHNRRRDEEAAKDFFTTDPAKVSVLLEFIRDGKLVRMPEKFAKQQIVLEQLAQSFEPGTKYPEAEVNGVLRSFHSDYAALRRYLVDSHLLDRDGGLYWRSGGTVPV